MPRGRLLTLVLGGLLLAGLAIHVALVVAAPDMEPLRVEPLLPDAARAPVDDDLALARAFAPWIYHETSERWGRQDIPTAMDFDGDLDGANAWESFGRYELVPTVYYSFAETETHLFLTYHLYHPRDWSTIMLGAQDTHEGDGESVQVVVEKANMTPVLVTAQAHYAASSYAAYPGPIASGRETLRGDFEIHVGHPRVYVEQGGHAIYGTKDPRAANRLAKPGDPVLVYRPAEEAETPAEPTMPYGGEHAYRLVSLHAFLNGTADAPGLFARPTDFDGHPVPRYHRGDRYSGPLGNSRGMSPFTLGYSYDRGEIGALFWDPAGEYPRALRIEEPWATDYVRAPWLGV